MDEGCVKQPQALDVKEDRKKIERKLGKSKLLEGLIWQNMKTFLALPLQMSLDRKHFWKQAWLAIRDTRQGCIFKKALSNRSILGGIDFDNRPVNTFMNEFKKNCNMGKKMASKLKMLAEKSMVEGDKYLIKFEGNFKILIFNPPSVAKLSYIWARWTKQSSRRSLSVSTRFSNIFDNIRQWLTMINRQWSIDHDHPVEVVWILFLFPS